MTQEKTGVYLRNVNRGTFWGMGAVADVADTPGKRLYLIRLALGDGFKSPLPADQFVARVKKATGVEYDPSTISRLENGQRRWLLEDAKPLAAVDPLRRGEIWLAHGVNVKDVVDPERDRKLTDDEVERAKRASEAARDEEAAASPRKRPPKRA